MCQQSEKHLEKIFNVDEFVKRIFTVMHSNDPIARALGLRTLGAVAGVIPEKQQVHHAIRRSLDSHDAVEVEAAIQASGQFAAQSKYVCDVYYNCFKPMIVFCAFSQGLCYQHVLQDGVHDRIAQDPNRYEAAVNTGVASHASRCEYCGSRQNPVHRIAAKISVGELCRSHLRFAYPTLGRYACRHSGPGNAAAHLLAGSPQAHSVQCPSVDAIVGQEGRPFVAKRNSAKSDF